MSKAKFDSENAGEVQNLLDLMTAYQRSEVLFTFVELKIADILNDEKLPAAKIAEILKIDRLATERFLNAAAMLGLLKRKNGLFSNSGMTRQFLVIAELSVVPVAEWLVFSDGQFAKERVSKL